MASLASGDQSAKAGEAREVDEGPKSAREIILLGRSYVAEYERYRRRPGRIAEACYELVTIGRGYRLLARFRPGYVCVGSGRYPGPDAHRTRPTFARRNGPSSCAVALECAVVAGSGMAKTRVRHDGASKGIRPRDPVIRRGATRRSERSRGLSGCSGVGAGALLVCSLVFGGLRLSA